MTRASDITDARAAVTLRRTSHLRWAVPPQTTTEPPELQQAWVDVLTGELSWRKIDTEVVEKVKQ